LLISDQNYGEMYEISYPSGGPPDMNQSEGGIYNPFSMGYLKDENGEDYYSTPIPIDQSEISDSQIVLIPQQESYQLQYPKIS